MSKKPGPGKHREKKVSDHNESPLTEEHMVLYERLARVIPGPVGKGVGSARSRSKKTS